MLVIRFTLLTVPKECHPLQVLQEHNHCHDGEGIKRTKEGIERESRERKNGGERRERVRETK